jgi:hypothetical protein
MVAGRGLSVGDRVARLERKAGSIERRLATPRRSDELTEVQRRATTLRTRIELARMQDLIMRAEIVVMRKAIADAPALIEAETWRRFRAGQVSR